MACFPWEQDVRAFNKGFPHRMVSIEGRVSGGENGKSKVEKVGQVMG